MESLKKRQEVDEYICVERFFKGTDVGSEYYIFNIQSNISLMLNYDLKKWFILNGRNLRYIYSFK